MLYYCTESERITLENRVIIHIRHSQNTGTGLFRSYATFFAYKMAVEGRRHDVRSSNSGLVYYFDGDVCRRYQEKQESETSVRATGETGEYRPTGQNICAASTVAETLDTENVFLE